MLSKALQVYFHNRNRKKLIFCFFVCFYFLKGVTVRPAGFGSFEVCKEDEQRRG
jgi:hypothetical protein